MAIENLWDKISVKCTNHEKPEELYILQNTEQIKTPFYRCKDDFCANRLNLDDYQDLVLYFMDIIGERPFDNLTNFTFDFKGKKHSYHIQVLVYKTEKIVLGIRNKTVLGS